MASPVASGNVQEARYLVGDLDKSLSSVSSQLSALVQRVKRLHESLYKPEGSSALLPSVQADIPSEPPAETFAPLEAEAPVETPASGEGAEALAEAAAETSEEPS